ncbi:LysR family transcriptional regulator [Tanticharoenia sakaeratensis]|uniref:LysR family transcriptional regulator n=1 Tax=Tanticharoenia sakaeratensis NBRC 103193 TaxID=1231623 RepID=A0A0D6MJV2_9PROT|nr:LysR family transcriptional regulator [Tanticharoenia sakaeratensis]GAN53563.1 LysR family transcriptional regulator [Tanticharoenia sakaeratensis NBRC 103193]GBQ17546.1 LysR family transcriptional regulator [Tanticharoenia sakaeratensis NBRC 103193]
MARLPDLEAWAIFAKIAETGSFAAAARALSLSRPTVSKAIARLEHRLRGALFVRGARRATLTQAGRAAIAHASALLHEGEVLEATLRDDLASPAGLVRLTVPVSFGIAHVAPLIAGFLRAYPGIELDVDLRDETVDLGTGAFDLAVRIGRPEAANLPPPVCTVARLLVASPLYLSRYGTPQMPEDLAQHAAIGFSQTQAPDLVRLHHARLGERSMRLRTRMRANNGDVALPALLDGVGLAVLPHFMVAEALRDGQLVRLLPEWRIAPLHLRLLVPGDNPSAPVIPARIRALRDWLARGLATDEIPVS